MKLSIGIVGLPNVGKSTLFKKLTSQDILVANYPFATIDPNVGIVPVPDARLDKLAEMSQSAKKVPAVVEFYDIAGLVKGANQGEGLGNKFLSHIRDTQAVAIVLRVFQSDEIIHVENSVDAERDMEIILTELALKDLETADKRLTKLEGEARTGDKQAIHNFEVLKKIKAKLEAGESIEEFAKEDIAKELNLLSSKKKIFLLNGQPEDVPAGLLEKLQTRGAGSIVVDLSGEPDLGDLIRKSYEILHLESFFTTGEDETRAWTIPVGAKAPEAAGAIHTDFEHKFIRAEVVAYDKFVEAGGWNQAKQKGWLRLEGKDYTVKDGDIMVIRHG